MSDVERVIKFGEFLRAHPALETFLCGFLCGTLAAIVIHLVLYFFAKKCSKKEYTYSSHLQALDAFCAEQKDIVKKGENDLVTKHPELLRYWDYEKNDVDPAEIFGGGASCIL